MLIYSEIWWEHVQERGCRPFVLLFVYQSSWLFACLPARLFVCPCLFLCLWLAYLPIHLPTCLCLDSSNAQNAIWTHNMNVREIVNMNETLLSIQWLHLRATALLLWTLKVWDAAVRIGLSCEALCVQAQYICSLGMCPKCPTLTLHAGIVAGGFRCLSRTAVWLHVLAAKGCGRTANTTWEPGSRGERNRADCGTLMKVKVGSNLARPCLRKTRDNQRSEDLLRQKSVSRLKYSLLWPFGLRFNEVSHWRPHKSFQVTAAFRLQRGQIPGGRTTCWTVILDSFATHAKHMTKYSNIFKCQMPPLRSRVWRVSNGKKAMQFFSILKSAPSVAKARRAEIGSGFGLVPSWVVDPTLNILQRNVGVNLIPTITPLVIVVFTYLQAVTSIVYGAQYVGCTSCY